MNAKLLIDFCWRIWTQGLVVLRIHQPHVVGNFYVNTLGVVTVIVTKLLLPKTSHDFVSIHF